MINNAISREFSQINNQDSILYDGEIMRVQMNKNIDNITIYGFEIFTKSLFANNYTMDNKVIFTAGLKSNNDPLAHIAPIQIKNNFKKKIGNSYIALSHTYYGKKDNEDFDKATEDIRMATRHLGMIVGKVDVEEILGSIFNDFCIGK